MLARHHVLKKNALAPPALPLVNGGAAEVAQMAALREREKKLEGPPEAGEASSPESAESMAVSRRHAAVQRVP